VVLCLIPSSYSYHRLKIKYYLAKNSLFLSFLYFFVCNSDYLVSPFDLSFDKGLGTRILQSLKLALAEKVTTCGYVVTGLRHSKFVLRLVQSNVLTLGSYTWYLYYLLSVGVGVSGHHWSTPRNNNKLGTLASFFGWQGCQLDYAPVVCLDEKFFQLAVVVQVSELLSRLNLSFITVFKLLKMSRCCTSYVYQWLSFVGEALNLRKLDITLFVATFDRERPESQQLSITILTHTNNF
jgi:hypothetical protein